MNEQFLEYIVQQPENHIDLCPLRIEDTDTQLHQCICIPEWFTGFTQD